MTIRTLVADDHGLVRDGLKLLLEADGDIRVVAQAADGLEAVRLADELRPDVVVLDVAMPGLNGIDAAAEVLARRPRTRVVLLSMHGSPEHVTRGLRSGALAYVLKECAGREIVEAVRAVAAGRRYLSQRVADVVLDRFLDDPRFDTPTEAVERLTRRERQVLQGVAEGKTCASIAANLGLSPKTVETYRSRLQAKLAVSGTAELVRVAARAGLVYLG